MTNGNGSPTWKWLVGVLILIVGFGSAYFIRANDRRLDELEKAKQASEAKSFEMAADLAVIKWRLEVLQNQVVNLDQQLIRMDGKLDQLAMDSKQSRDWRERVRNWKGTQ